MSDRHNILLVEDDRAQQRTLEAILTQEGMSVTICDNAQTAKTHLTSGRFPVCVLDQRLRGDSATSLLQQLPANIRTRFIIHTAYASVSSAKDAVNHGVFAYCEKLGNPRELLLSIHNAVHDFLATELSDAESEIRLQMRLLDAVQQAVVATDLSFRVIYRNQFAEKLYGDEAVRIHGADARHLIIPSGMDSLQQSLFQSLRTGKSWSSEFIGDDCASLGFPVEVTVSPIFDQQSSLIGMTAISTDISERLRLRREHDELQHQFFQSQKMESVGRLAGGIAHDFNNLLCVIQTSAELLQQRTTATDAGRAASDLILQSTERASALTRQLLAFSRNQNLSLQIVDLNRIIEDFSGLIRRTLRDDVSLKLELADDLPCLEGDVAQLEQVLLNLAVNAQHAMPNGGTLTIRTGVRVDSSSEPDNQDRTGNSEVELVVSDTGDGIPPDVLENIFEPFFTTKPTDRGSGLGLAMVQGVVRQHNGNVDVVSHVGEGTTFRLSFPASDNAAEPRSSQRIDPPAERGSERILLVEDNDAVRMVTETLLTSSGHTVFSCTNGHEALKFQEQHSGQFDLLLTDFMMPGMNGGELAERIQCREPAVKVLFMSAYADGHVDVDRLVSNANFIDKPFSISDLNAKVHHALHGPYAEVVN